MSHPALNLPPSTAYLGDVLTRHEDFLKLLRWTNARIGGGTVLAIHWGNHRVSTDIDLMVPAEAFDRRKDQIRDLLRAIPAKDDDAIVDKIRRTVIVFKQIGIKGEDNDPPERYGDIEVVRDNLGDELRRTRDHGTGPLVEPIGIHAEAKAHILAKKFHRLGRQHLERDHYDVLWAAYNDRETLIEAVMHHVEPDSVDEIAADAQENPNILFAQEEKPVLHPAAPGWKNVLGEVWTGIREFTTNPRATHLELPDLEGVPPTQHNRSMER